MMSREERGRGAAVKPRPVSVRGVEGEWVLLVKDRVVISSRSAEDVFKEALRYPPDEAVVTKVLSAGASFY